MALMEQRFPPAPEPRLWTKDFTIITLGTVVSMLGNAVSGFAIGLLVLDKTDSVFLYALFMVCYCLPKIVLPLLAGPFLDRFSRKKTIYLLDFLSSALYLGVYVLIRVDFFIYPVFVLTAMVIGGIDSVYTVAYDSFYPTLIAKGNFTRAYSVASLIYPLATTIMVPVAAACYESVGLAPLFLFNSATFLVAAIAETRITAGESHVAAQPGALFSRGRFKEDFKAGLEYLRNEKGLATITKYFFVTMLCYGVADTLLLPYFRSIGEVSKYATVMAASTVGRLVGGLAQYRFRYPPKKKYAIAIFVYLFSCSLEGGYLFAPYSLMIACSFLMGLTSVTSYNIRLSGTQNYVPNEVRGRFNGVFQMMNMLGTIIGQLIAGALGGFVSVRLAAAGAMAVDIICVFLIFFPNAEHVKKVYNVES